jgi:hypothetical protein
MSLSEPPRPQRGATMAERGSDASEPEREVVEARSWAGKLGAAINPRFLLSQADGYPVGIKQFLQFCLILIYPAWLFMVLLAWPVWLVGKALEAILMVVFWPVRARHKRKNPEEYAAFQEELKARKGR